MAIRPEEFNKPRETGKDQEALKVLEKEKAFGQELGDVFVGALKDTDANEIIWDGDPNLTKGRTMKISFLDFGRGSLKTDKPKKIKITFGEMMDVPDKPGEVKQNESQVLMIYLDKNGKIDSNEPFALNDLEKRVVEDVKYEERKKAGRIQEGSPRLVVQEKASWERPNLSEVRALLYPYKDDIGGESDRQKKSIAI